MRKQSLREREREREREKEIIKAPVCELNFVSIKTEYV